MRIQKKIVTKSEKTISVLSVAFDLMSNLQMKFASLKWIRRIDVDFACDRIENGSEKLNRRQNFMPSMLTKFIFGFGSFDLYANKFRATLVRQSNPIACDAKKNRTQNYCDNVFSRAFFLRSLKTTWKHENYDRKTYVTLCWSFALLSFMRSLKRLFMCFYLCLSMFDRFESNAKQRQGKKL